MTTEENVCVLNYTLILVIVSKLVHLLPKNQGLWANK